MIGMSMYGLSWGSSFSSMARSQMFTAWSAMRSRSVVIFMAVVMKRRSLAAGWCRASRRRQSSSISRSRMSTFRSEAMTSSARRESRSTREATACSTMVSTRLPSLSVFSLTSSSSS